MKRLKSIVVLSLLAVFGFHSSAQDLYKLETPYEKARAKLADEAVGAIMKNDFQIQLAMAIAMNTMAEENWSEWKQLEYMEQVIATAWGAYQWSEPQTFSDLRAFARIGPACEEYARKREALEKTKTPLDIERERKRKYVPPVGALSTILIKTGEEFSKLFVKGKYEKNSQFQQRVAESGPRTFDSIAYMYCMGHALASLQHNRWDYDVENELDSLYVWHHENNKVLATCHMSPEMNQRVSNKHKDIHGYELKVCIVNGEVLPYKMVMDTEDEQWEYVFSPIANNVIIDTNIVFSVSKTGITDSNILQAMGDHVFDYNKKIQFNLSKPYVQKGDSNLSIQNYVEAKKNYEEALKISPDDNTIKAKIKEVDLVIAEQERKARRLAEEKQVRMDVDNYILSAQNNIKQGHLETAVETLEDAIKVTKVHNYDYRKEEMEQRVDSIRRIQDLIIDDNIVFDYKEFRPDLYMTTQNILNLKIKSYLREKEKDVEANHMTLSLYTNNQPGTFQLKESSKTLKKFCEYALENVQLTPLVIDDLPLKSCATFNYDVEYVSGTVKVSSDGGHLQVNPRFDMSPRLEYNLGQVFSEKMSGMSSFYDGTYKFDVKSMDINGQMEHSVVFERVHAANGPQNAWKSLLVPGLGDLYVDGFFGKDEMRKIWWIVPVTCYTAVGMGIWGILNPQEKQTYNMQTNTYETKDNKSTWIGMIAVGGAIWVADVVQVWIKGAKNKRECEERIGKINFAYDAMFDAPELVYSLSF